MILIIFIVIAVLALAVAAFAKYAYKQCFYSPKPGDDELYRLPHDSNRVATPEQKAEMFAMIRHMYEEPFREVSTVSHDGLRLYGNFYDFNGPDAPLAICVHGYRSTPIRDFCGGAFTLRDMGFNVLAVRHRAHCGSEGHTIAFGIEERFDVLYWIDFAKKEFGEDVRIQLYGISMGATTVLMASGLELPSNVERIVADCPYNSPEDIIKEVMKDGGYPAFFYHFIVLGARLYGHFNLEETTAAEGVAKAKVPILIIHGEDDGFVPCEMSGQIAAASPAGADGRPLVRRETFPGAKHGMSFTSDQPRYEALIKKFMNEQQ